MIMREEENVYLERLGQDYASSLMKDGISFADLKNAFLESKIDLEMDKPNVTWIMSESLLGDIEKAMRDFLMIAEKPRSFIETHDEKVLVESASRIGHKAIAQLSRDSKDWYARTFVSVKPKNITAEISEETFNIYENRVYVSLIRRIERDVYSKKRDVEERLRKQEETLSSKDIDAYFGLNSDDASAWSFGLYKKAIWKKENYTDDQELNELRDLLGRIDKITHQITRIKNSPVYKSLRKIKNEHSPILQTNIFLYDRRYKKVISLWRAMDKERFQLDEEINDRTIRDQQAKINYGLYVLLTFAYAFADLGYEAAPTSGKLFYDSKEAYVNGSLNLRKGGHEFKLSGRTGDGELRLSYENAELKIKRKTFIIHINYENFEELPSVIELDEETKKLLNANRPKKEGRNSTDERHITCISFDGASKLGDLLDEKLARRLLSFGDSFSQKENLEDISAWGNYQTGFLDIVPQRNFRNNLLKVERLLSHITVENLTKDLIKAEGVCPVCGLPGLKQSGSEDTDYLCRHCKHLVSFTPHKHCHVDKKENMFLWVKPIDTSFLQQQKERFHFKEGQNKFLLYQFSQFVFGKYATTGFAVQLGENGEVQANTICPKCGDIMK